MNSAITKIQYFANLFNNLCSDSESEREIVRKRLLEAVNNLESSELNKLSAYYNNPDYVYLLNKFKEGTLKKEDKGAVSVLRNILLKHLLNGTILTQEIIEAEKQKILEVVHKDVLNYNPFHSWKIDRILYHFCYFSHKEIIQKFLESFVEQVRKKLSISNITKKNIVTFDGAQNQGFDHCWIAIYDEIFRSQQETKQIYVGFWENEIVFDIYEHTTGVWGLDSNEPGGRLSYEDFSIEKVVEFFQDKKDAIFELRKKEQELDISKKNFQKNKKLTKREKSQIESKIYTEESKINSQTQVVNRQNHHYKIYNLIKDYLRDNYDSYSIEENNVDIIASKNGETYLFEIKPYENSAYTLRVALGQLIEYYYKGNKSAKFLCFVGIQPLKDNKVFFKYLKDLFANQEFKLRYFYVDYANSCLVEDFE